MSSVQATNCSTATHLLRLIVFSLCKNSSRSTPITLPLSSNTTISQRSLTVPSSKFPFPSPSSNPSFVSDVLALLTAIVRSFSDHVTASKTQGLLRTFSSFSLYGLLLSTRSLLSHLAVCFSEKSCEASAREFCHSAVDACLSVAGLVRAVVCDVSPEGLVVEDGECFDEIIFTSIL